MTYENGAALTHGLEFRFSELPDFRGDSHWHYLQLDAHHPSQEKSIGYLRVAFVPVDMAQAMNEERLLLVQTRGHHIYPRPKLRAEKRVIYDDPNAWDRWKTDPRHAARYVMETILHMPYMQWNDNLSQMTPEQLVEMVETHRPHLNKETQPLLEKMFEFAVNKADMDFVSVDDAWQRKGIALSMYRAMAKFLDEQHGITLNASTTQTQEAQHCWLRMAKDGLVEQDAKGRYFFTHGIRETTLEQRDVAPAPVPMPPEKPKRRPRAR